MEYSVDKGNIRDMGLTKDNPQLTREGELWTVYCEYLGEK